MWPSTVVGKSFGQPALLFQREVRTNSKSQRQSVGMNRSRRSLKEEKHDKYREKTKTASQSEV